MCRKEKKRKKTPKRTERFKTALSGNTQQELGKRHAARPVLNPLTGPAAPWCIQPRWGSAEPGSPRAAAAAPAPPLAPYADYLCPAEGWTGVQEDRSHSCLPGEAPQHWTEQQSVCFKVLENIFHFCFNQAQSKFIHKNQAADSTISHFLTRGKE